MTSQKCKLERIEDDIVELYFKLRNKEDINLLAGEFIL